jgi:hypothetical protein
VGDVKKNDKKLTAMDTTTLPYWADKGPKAVSNHMSFGGGLRFHNNMSNLVLIGQKVFSRRHSCLACNTTL